MNRKLSHLSPVYVRDRLLLALNQKLHPNNPWITANAAALLNDLLKSTDVGVEFGSGRSTAWFTKRIKHLTSIESSSTWFEIVSTKIAQSNLVNKVDYRLCETELEYAAQADSFPDDSIDFCLVDGIARDQCAINMIPKIRRGGLLAIDNINLYLPNNSTKSPNSRRSHDGAASAKWKDFEQAVIQWRRAWTSNGIFDTCIWFKP